MTQQPYPVSIPALWAVVFGMARVYFFLLLAFTACSPATPPTPAQHDKVAQPPKIPAQEIAQTLEEMRGMREKLVHGRKDALLQRLSKEPMFKKATKATLEARNYEYLFSLESGPTKHTKALYSALKELPDHAIALDAYPLAAIEAAIAAISEAYAKVEKARTEASSTPQFAHLLTLVEKEEPPSVDVISFQVEEGPLKGLSQEGLSRWAEAMRVLLRELGELEKSRAELEILCSVAFFRFALDMKFLIRASPFRADKDPKAADIVHLEKILAAFDVFARDPESGIKALIPKHPYYEGLKKGLKRYKAIAERGGFTVVPEAGKLKQGARGKAVLALKRRLFEEGYYEGNLEEAVFDAALEMAVKEYQNTHGFEPTGEVDKPLYRSLNVPVEQRIRQIELGLQRWRESEVRHEEPLYVRVNIPEFKMEVWENGQLLRKHKVVVGNNNWDRDPDARIEGRINRTKIFSAAITQVVLNPRWYVPARIRRLELDFEVLQEPDYFAKRKFKVKVNPDGTEEIYQDSGDDNALGRVKFVFPNPYGIFMHDTNLKPLFAKEIRAFSHGCIRLENPLEVAFLLLEKRAGIDRQKAERLLASGDVHEIKLDPPVPIFVEYVSVGVDAKGRIEFYSDVYQYDKDYYDGKIPYSEEELKLLMRKIPKVD